MNVLSRIYDLRKEIIKEYGVTDNPVVEIKLSREVFDRFVFDLYRKQNENIARASCNPSDIATLQVCGVRITTK